MTAVLSEIELGRIQALREAGVLAEINKEMLDNARNGTILITCADGHHFSDLYQHHTKLCGAHEKMMHHPLALNGGALLLPRNSPLRRMPDGYYAMDDVVLLRNLEGAIALKKPRTVILYAHAPCGMAKLYDLSIDDEFELLAAAKVRVREHIAPLGVTDVRLWFHVYDGDRRTYHFRRPAWDAFIGRSAAQAA